MQTVIIRELVLEKPLDILLVTCYLLKISLGPLSAQIGSCRGPHIRASSHSVIKTHLARLVAVSKDVSLKSLLENVAVRTLFHHQRQPVKKSRSTSFNGSHPNIGPTSLFLQMMWVITVS